MKLLVETTGSFMLLDTGGRQEVSAQRPTVVTDTAFITNRIGLGQLDILAQLNDEATDQEFEKYWEDSENRDLAVSAFSEAFSREPKAPKRAPKR